MVTSSEGGLLPLGELAPLIAQARAIIGHATRISIFTGAGVSAESGIPTFRDQGGFWTRFPPAQFANWAGLQHLIQKDPLRVAEFVVELLRPILNARPNPAHETIAALEALDKTVTVITQNIDGLHQLAGSTRVIEIHGSVFEVLQTNAGPPIGIRRLQRADLSVTVSELEEFLRTGNSDTARFLHAARSIFGRNSQGFYRPNLVLFGDVLPQDAWQQATAAADTRDCLLVIGTSNLITPASTIPEIARSKGAKIIAIGYDPCPCDVCLRGAAGIILPYVKENK